MVVTDARRAVARIAFVAVLVVAGPLEAGQRAAPRAMRARSVSRPGVSKVVNRNARIPPRAYTRPHQRNLQSYQRFLGAGFVAALDGARKGDVWIDSGGGLGVAALEGALSRGLETYVINAQDFWRARMPRETIESLAVDLGVDTADVPVATRRVWRSGGMVDVPSFEQLGDEHYATLAARARAKKRAATRAGRFKYLVGFSEDKLPTIRPRARIITDLYGAYFYSADRVRLLDLYYGALAEGGEAFIRFATDSGDGPRSVVRTAAGPVPLERYLVKTYPRRFRISRADPRVLVMSRPAGGPARLALDERLRMVSHDMVEVGGMELPGAVLEERNLLRDRDAPGR